MSRWFARGIGRIGAYSLVALLLVTGCSVAAPPAQVQPPPLIDRSVLAPNANPRTVSPVVTYTVTRGTISETLSIPGRVVAARSAEVAFRGTGTISAINVQAGQSVSKDDVLAELTLDAETLDGLRSRAASADLTYENQLARIDELQHGAGPEALASAQAAVARAQTSVARAQLARATVQQEIQAAEEARSAAQESVDRQVTLAEIGVEQAQDELDDARAELARVQEVVRARGAAGNGLAPDTSLAVAQAQDQAEADISAATAAQRAAERKAQQAALALQEAQANPNERKAQRDLQDAQAKLTLADQDLKAVQRDAERPDRTKDPTGVLAAAAVDKIHDAARAYEAAQTLVQHLEEDLQAAQVADQHATALARIAQEQAQDELEQARLAQPRVQRSAQRGIEQAQLPALTTSAAASQSQAVVTPDPVAATQARVRGAERQLQIAQLKLDDAHSSQASSQTAVDTKARAADLEVQAAQAELEFAQAAAAELQKGPATDALARERRRAELLRDDADAAHEALKPVQQVKAPFDGVIASVEVQSGQLADGHTPVVRLVAAGTLSVTAEATESDITRLEPGQQVDLTFPGLGDETGRGVITAINTAAATSSTTTAATDRKQVIYPVQIDLASSPRQLKLGMTATLNLEVRNAKDVLHVPSAALRKLEDHNVVTLVGADGSLVDAPVQVGGTYGSDVEILSGVKEGDTVAVLTPVTATAQKPSP
jgi:RND family efflux transporter MFP subunit